jgi:hypothetical protein
MAAGVPDLERLIADAGFKQVRSEEAPPWLRYSRGSKPLAETSSR